MQPALAFITDRTTSLVKYSSVQKDKAKINKLKNSLSLKEEDKNKLTYFTHELARRVSERNGDVSFRNAKQWQKLYCSCKAMATNTDCCKANSAMRECK